MRYSIPHPIPYQGSKRRLARAILSHVPSGRFRRLVEPFAGSAAVTLAAAASDQFQTFLMGDRLEPLANLWRSIVENPGTVADRYEALWLRERENPIDEFYKIRAEFNLDGEAAKLLYLLARCVKNAVRFNPAGEFNQSPDKRRKGTHPRSMRRELEGAHRLLHGRAKVECSDFLELFDRAKVGDFFYLDPPYQGTTEGRDSRYIRGVTRHQIIHGLRILNGNSIPFILSYDGSCGDQTYGEPLPADIGLRILLDVGRSSQATLNGRDHVTIESLYVSRTLMPENKIDRPMQLRDFEPTQAMTGSLF